MAPNSLAIARAVRLIATHNAVVSVKLEPNAETGEVLATVKIKTELPSEGDLLARIVRREMRRTHQLPFRTPLPSSPPLI